MSTELLLLITVIIVGILAAIAYIAFNRWFDAREEDTGQAESEFTIAPYGEIRKKLAAITPSSVRRKELTMTPEDIVSLVDGLDAEVNNGGFDQFFFNSTGDYALETIDALRIVGATRTAEIVRIACDRFPDGRPPLDIGERRTLMLDSVSPEAETFDDLDRRFYEYEEPLTELIEVYKEKHSL